ncbi:hypothetical protein J6590_019557 [Homalodisca vitripennis]|nr:hypothetical protein J6590_019557 [Homalodisca vitripennis]
MKQCRNSDLQASGPLEEDAESNTSINNLVIKDAAKNRLRERTRDAERENESSLYGGSLPNNSGETADRSNNNGLQLTAVGDI